MNPGHGAPRDYSQSPANVYWEMTRACSLRCRHCRAEAAPNADPAQLTPGEGMALLSHIEEFGRPYPQLILTGGDPLERKDVFEIVAAAHRRGITVSITPAATPKLTRAVLEQLRDAGLDGLGLSLDASTAMHHDGLRGEPGTFDRTLQAMQWAGELGLRLQVNSLVAAETQAHLPAIYRLLCRYQPARWSLFFLISVGRGRVLEPLAPAAAEQLMVWVDAVSRTAPFTVATTEAPSFRRVAIEQGRAAGLQGAAVAGPAARGFGIRDGHGVVFVSHTGDICPAGFLPVAVGNVRQHRLAAIYRGEYLFTLLHDPKQFGGRCGVCNYQAVCGGSRARAFAATGDPLAADPLCLYSTQPQLAN